MPNFEEGKGYSMQMGMHSEDSDTTFKAKDQENIKSGPGYTRDGRPSKYPRSSGKFFYNKTKPTAKAPSQPKKADIGAAKQSFLSSAGPAKPKAKKVTTPSPAPAPKPKAKSVSAISPAKSASISIAAPKPTASASVPTPKPKAAVSTPKTKSSKIREKGEIALASGKVKKAQRLRKRYDRIKKRENKKAGIADAYKVNL